MQAHSVWQLPYTRLTNSNIFRITPGKKVISIGRMPEAMKRDLLIRILDFMDVFI